MESYKDFGTSKKSLQISHVIDVFNLKGERKLRAFLEKKTPTKIFGLISIREEVMGD
jgi:hypothetical protein